MKSQLIYAVATGAMCVCLSTPLIAKESGDIQSALTAQASFTDMRGSPLSELPRGEPFTITVAIENTVGSEPPAGLYLNGWLRQRSERNLDCQSAARAYRATGRTPIGSVDLNGPVIGVLTDEGHLTIADPELDLASANLIGAASFNELPTAFITDPDTNRFLVSLGKAGVVQAVNVFSGEAVTLAKNLNQPGTLMPALHGAVWVLEKGSGDVLYLAPGDNHKRIPLNASAMDAGNHGHSFVAWNETDLHVLDRHSGKPIIDVVRLKPRFEANRSKPKHLTDTADADMRNVPVLVDAIAIEDQRSTFAVAALTETGVSLYFIDDPARPVYIKLGTSAQRLAVDPSSRFLFAYSHDGGDTFIIDIARSRVVQVVGAGTPVSNIEFTDNAAFLLLADQSMVGVIELASIKAGQHAKIRQVALGQPTSQQNTTQKQLLASLTPRNEMLAVHADSFTGFVIHETSAMGDSPPMSAIKLRGGVPYQVKVLDRSFKEKSTGTFQTTAMLPLHGQYELVVTTGIGSLSACMPLIAMGSDVVNDLEPGTISLVQASANDLGKRLRLNMADGGPAQQVRAEVTFSALEANWLLRADLETDQEGISRSSYELPALGEYVITVSTATAHEFQPLQFRVD